MGCWTTWPHGSTTGKHELVELSLLRSDFDQCSEAAGLAGVGEGDVAVAAGDVGVGEQG